DASDERAAVMMRLLLGGLERLGADDLAQLLRLDRRSVDREVEVHLGSHVLLDVDRDLQGLTAAAGANVLRPDSERDAAPGVSPKLRALREHGLRNGKLVRAETDRAVRE